MDQTKNKKVILPNLIDRRTLLHSLLHLAPATLLLTHSKMAKATICVSTPGQTPGQTPGPFIPDDFPFKSLDEGHPYIISNDSDADLTSISGQSELALGQKLYLEGQVVDENCVPVPNSQVYLWQADDQGHYNHSEDPNINFLNKPILNLDPGFQYRGIVRTDNQGRFSFKTIKPKYYPLDPQDIHFKRTSHFHLSVMKPGFQNLFTQSYFEGDELEDIIEIRRLNKIDILLGEWIGRGLNRRPTGKVNSVFLPLIVNYEHRSGYDAPVGNLKIYIRRV